MVFFVAKNSLLKNKNCFQKFRGKEVIILGGGGKNGVLWTKILANLANSSLSLVSLPKFFCSSFDFLFISLFIASTSLSWIVCNFFLSSSWFEVIKFFRQSFRESMYFLQISDSALKWSVHKLTNLSMFSLCNWLNCTRDEKKQLGTCKRKQNGTAFNSVLKPETVYWNQLQNKNEDEQTLSWFSFTNRSCSSLPLFSAFFSAFWCPSFIFFSSDFILVFIFAWALNK